MNSSLRTYYKEKHAKLSSYPKLLFFINRSTDSLLSILLYCFLLLFMQNRLIFLNFFNNWIISNFLQ